MKCFLFSTSTAAMKAKYIIDKTRIRNYVKKHKSEQGCKWCLVVNENHQQRVANTLNARNIQYLEIRDYE